MPFDLKPMRNVASMVVAIGCVFVLLVVPSAQAQLPELRVKVSDTTAQPGATNTVISVYLNNYQDTVAGFNLLLQLNRPDIMIFQTDSAIVIDTTFWRCTAWDGPDCVDSIIVPEDSAWDFMHIDTNDIAIGHWDTTGTLLSGWQYVDAHSLSETGFDLNIAGIANLPQGDTIPGIAPQQGGLLIELLADVFDIPDSMTDRTVDIMIERDMLAHFNFSRPDGSSIGLLYDSVADTNCWECTIWAGPECLNWERISVPPGCEEIEECCPDSFTIVIDSIAYIDTVNVKLRDGSLTVESFVCGNIDGDPAGEVNVADLTYLVSFLFLGGPAPQPMASGNVDCLGGDTPNIADLTYLVNFLFRGGPAPCAGC